MVKDAIKRIQANIAGLYTAIVAATAKTEFPVLGLTKPSSAGAEYESQPVPTTSLIPEDQDTIYQRLGINPLTEEQMEAIQKQMSEGDSVGYNMMKPTTPVEITPMPTEITPATPGTIEEVVMGPSPPPKKWKLLLEADQDPHLEYPNEFRDFMSYN